MLLTPRLTQANLHDKLIKPRVWARRRNMQLSEVWAKEKPEDSIAVIFLRFPLLVHVLVSPFALIRGKRINATKIRDRKSRDVYLSALNWNHSYLLIHPCMLYCIQAERLFVPRRFLAVIGLITLSATGSVAIANPRNWDRNSKTRNCNTLKISTQ